MERYLSKSIIADLCDKIVFLSGPRQVGKTTVAMQALGQIVQNPDDRVYLNWDRAEHRKTMRDLSWSRAGAVADQRRTSVSVLTARTSAASPAPRTCPPYARTVD